VAASALVGLVCTPRFKLEDVDQRKILESFKGLAQTVLGPLANPDRPNTIATQAHNYVAISRYSSKVVLEHCEERLSAPHWEYLLHLAENLTHNNVRFEIQLLTKGTKW